MTDDLISRQAVLDLLFNSYIKTELTSIGDASKEYAELCVDELKELPPVNPQEPKTIQETPTDSVIEDIKAEINEGIESYKNKDKAVMYGFMCALYIIDKHIEGWDKE